MTTTEESAPPPYQIAWAPRARREASRLPERIAGAIAEFVYGPLAENPHRVGKPLRDDLAGHHSARRGGFRIVYRIDADARLVSIERVGYRTDVYRPD